MEEISLTRKYLSKKTLVKSFRDDDLSEAPKHTINQQYTQQNSFNQILKIKEKQKQVEQINKKNNNFIERFYKKLQQQLQNCKQPKTMKDNVKMLEICLKKKHTRNNTSRNTPRTSHTSRLQSAKKSNKQNDNYLKIKTNQDKYHAFYQQKASNIIDICNKEKILSYEVHKQINLLKFYNTKINQRLIKTNKKIKKAVMEF